MAGDITAANITFFLSVPGVYTAAQQLQDFSVDDIFDVETVQSKEIQVGADGGGVAGWLPRMTPQSIRFLPSSQSVNIFEAWQAAEDNGGPAVIYASGVVVYPSLGRRYTLLRGTLSKYQAAPSAGKVLKTREFEITWLPQLGGVAPILGTPL